MSEEAVTQESAVDSAKKISFADRTMQTKIAALSLRDVTFMGQVEGLVRPEYFDDEEVACVVDIAQRYYRKYKRTFGDVNTFNLFGKSLFKQKVYRRELALDVIKQGQRLFYVDISDRDWVVDNISKFARHAAVSNAIIEIADKHLDIGNFEAIQKVLNDALQVGAYADSAGYDYGEEIESRTNERIDRVSGALPPDGITSGYKEIDEYLQPHNGWGRKELAILMGPPKIGKSTALLDFGLRACGCPRKYNVLYVTLEVSTKIISERADANISSIAMRDVTGSNQRVKTAVTDWRNGAGKFIIEERPPNTMKVSDLKRVIDKYKRKGLIFDLVIVDYADLMIPEYRTKDAIENSRTIWADLRGLGVVENFAVLSATQTNREGAKKITSSTTDVAEDFNKVRIADVFIAINKTDEEKAVGECRLGFSAIRNAESGFSIRIKQNINCMQFVTDVMGVE